MRWGGVTSTLCSVCRSKRSWNGTCSEQHPCGEHPRRNCPFRGAVGTGSFLQRVMLPVLWLKDRAGSSSASGAPHLVVVMAAHVTFTRRHGGVQFFQEWIAFVTGPSRNRMSQKRIALASRVTPVFAVDVPQELPWEEPQPQLQQSRTEQGPRALEGVILFRAVCNHSAGSAGCCPPA